jgi:amidase
LSQIYALLSTLHRLTSRLFPAYTEQDDLVKALQNEEDSQYIDKLKAGLRYVGRRILDRTFAAEDINIIAAPADSSLCVHAAAAGYPIATVPLGQLRYNGRPFGICLVAKANYEEALLRFMAAWQLLMNPRRPVPALL